MRVCEITGKGTTSGNSVSHSHKATKRVWKINLQSTKLAVNGESLKVRVSTKALKTLKGATEAEVLRYLKANKATLSKKVAKLIAQ